MKTHKTELVKKENKPNKGDVDYPYVCRYHSVDTILKFQSTPPQVAPELAEGVRGDKITKIRSSAECFLTTV